MKSLVAKYGVAVLTIGIFAGSIGTLQALQTTSPVRWSEGTNSGGGCGDETVRPAQPASDAASDQAAYGPEL